MYTCTYRGLVTFICLLWHSEYSDPAQSESIWLLPFTQVWRWTQLGGGGGGMRKGETHRNMYRQAGITWVVCSDGDTSSSETQYIYDLPLSSRRLRQVSVHLNRNYNAKECILHGVQPSSPATYSQFQGVNAFILLKAVVAFPVNCRQ